MSQVQNPNQIKLNIKTYIENVEDIKHNDYIKALIRKVRKIVEQYKEKIVNTLMEYKDSDICDLNISIELPHEIILTANGNIKAMIYYSHDYDLDYDLIINEYHIEIYKGNDIIERGKLYIAISGWNRICGDWKVEELLEENDYNVELDIIYMPRTIEDDDP